VPALLIICCAAPAGIIAVYTLVIDGIFSNSGGRKKYPFKKRLWELNCGILGLMLAVGASFVITGTDCGETCGNGRTLMWMRWLGTLKNAIGKPRPDLIARCNLTATEVSGFFENGNYSLAGHEHCHQSDNAILKDGFRSFPSGHSSSTLNFGTLQTL
jgi:diacylglycerol diphosphate phosphatase/phosphatidate phosphatase